MPTNLNQIAKGGSRNFLNLYDNLMIIFKLSLKYFCVESASSTFVNYLFINTAIGAKLPYLR